MRSTDSRKLGRSLAPGVFPGILVLLLASVLVVAAGCGGGGDTTTTLGPTSSETVAETTTSTTMAETTTTTLFDIHSVTSSTSSASTTATSGGTTTTEALSSAETRLPSGHIKAMGYIDRVWEEGGKRYIRIDYAEFADDPTAAARAAGEIGPDEEWELDYYISNVNPLKREFEVSDSVVITTSTRWVAGDDMGAPCTWADFKSFWGPGPMPGPYPESEVHLHAVPWWIERDGPVVVKIDEQYLP
jgi:hypothetical protein